MGNFDCKFTDFNFAELTTKEMEFFWISDDYSNNINVLYKSYKISKSTRC